MDKTYNPEAIEQRWYQVWEEQAHFAPKEAELSYCIMIPPPNVTGSLHMGHAFQDTIMDALIRYHRMLGHSTLWQAGTDHAGIATQMVVERQLNAEGKTRHDLGRDAFVNKVWQWKEQSGGFITKQLRRMGASLDWSRERFTMDDGLSEAVHEVFVRLYEENLIYRGKRLVNWDPVLHTAVSDLEVLSEEEKGHLWHMRYPLEDGTGHVIVATTRPETMLGDAAVAVHPDDTRYQHLLGKWVRLPLTQRKIPIITDEYVDPEFGTGCVKITPAHDFNDYEVWQRHKDSDSLKQVANNGLLNIFTVDAKIRQPRPDGMESDEEKAEGIAISSWIPAAYQGMDRFQARKQIVADLEVAECLACIEDHTLMVPRGDRTGAVIEPFLTDQWFVKMEPLAKPALQAVENGSIRFVPDNWKNTYYEWMRNIQDWCISRQIWWGHRIPAWYDDTNQLYVGRNEAEVRSKYQLADHVALRQDEDVLDTWFSSALWPFSTLGWPASTPELSKFYPTNVLVTGFDIIFFWVARMIMMGLKFMDDVPFREIYIHGLVRDSHGQKMSKSKGNVLDPIDLIDGIDLESLVSKRVSGLMQPKMAKQIEKTTRADFPSGIPPFGTDALRFTFASLASTGRNINFDLGRIEGYRNFCNKLWNAARYVLMNVENEDCGHGNTELDYSAADLWISSQLQSVVQQVNDAVAHYRFDLAAQAIYEFTWNEYCDWYLELSKPVLTNPTSPEPAKRATRKTLVTVLETLLRLAHPIIPFITEEIWQRVAPFANGTGKTIMHAHYPEYDEKRVDANAVAEIEWVKSFVLGVRKIRSGQNIDPRKPLPVLLSNGDKQDKKRLSKHQQNVTTLARLDSITWLDDESTAPESATALVGDMKVFIPMAGLIDKNEELARLDREIAKIQKDVDKGVAKLENEKFISKAPADIVEKERTRVSNLHSSLQSLLEQRERIAAM